MRGFTDLWRLQQVTPDELRQVAESAANTAGLDRVLVFAVCEQESSWKPWAVRYEPAFYMHYISHMKGLPNTEMMLRACSFGLMQVMGQVAREQGFTGEFLTELCMPEVGLTYACKKLSLEIGKANGDQRAALSAYNGGGNPAYPDQVLARMSKYF